MDEDKFKIIVIDDDKGVCLLVKSLLEKTKQFEVVGVNDPKTAEGVCKKEKPDMIIIDNVMPDIKGSELVKTFKEKKATQDIPIVMLTGKGEMIYSDEKQSFEWKPNNPMVKKRGDIEEHKRPTSIKKAYGVDAYLPKPLSPDRLMEVIDKILVKKRDKEELEEWKKYNT